MSVRVRVLIVSQWIGDGDRGANEIAGPISRSEPRQRRWSAVNGRGKKGRVEKKRERKERKKRESETLVLTIMYLDVGRAVEAPSDQKRSSREWRAN